VSIDGYKPAAFVEWIRCYSSWRSFIGRGLAKCGQAGFVGAAHVRVLANIFYLVISDFRRNVDENCAHLGYYAASSGNFLKEFTTTRCLITQEKAYSSF